MGTTPADKDGFFNAIINERYLEFGHEGIRKFDLIRWNLLATKLEEARTKIQQIRDRVGPYSNVPQYIYWRNVGEEIQYFVPGATAANAVPWYRPTQVPSPTTGWTRTNWAEDLNRNVIDALPIHQAMARFFTPGKSELFPFDQATLQSYQGRLKQNPGYPQ